MSRVLRRGFFLVDFFWLGREKGGAGNTNVCPCGPFFALLSHRDDCLVRFSPSSCSTYVFVPYILAVFAPLNPHAPESL